MKASRDPDERAEVVRRGLAFESSPAEFTGRWAEQETLPALRPTGEPV
ncbi:hypothetical protein [Streptosporangium sp. KLBMP 9127]|nr:hypothetical protein [Streptosporangium sp. KLBMP 9127]